MVTSQNKWKIPEWDEKLQTNKQAGRNITNKQTNQTRHAKH